MLELRQKLETAWQLRMSREVEPCLTLCTELKQAVGLAPGEFTASDLERLSQKLEWDLVSEVALLWASLTRALKDLEQSVNLIQEVETFIWKHEPKGTFHFHFEKGTTSLVKGDYSKALDYFLAASEQTDRDWKKLCADANALFCLERLGLPQGEAAKKVKEVLKGLQENSAIRFVKEQMVAYEMRSLFRVGKVKEALRLSNSREKGQCLYYGLWLKLLPYHSSYAPLSAEKLSFLTQERFFQNKDYRLRSLKGTLHPDDLLSDRFSELADRLYLWVWKWLVDPKSFSIEKTVSQLKCLNLHRDSHRMTVEDTLLIRNSLLWLSLFDPSHEKVIQDLLSQMEAPATSDFLLLQFERIFIHYCVALRDGKETLIEDYLEELKTHPLWNGDEVLLPLLVQALGKEKIQIPQVLTAFLDHLRSVVLPKLPSGEAKFTVDLIENSVSGLGLKKPIYSQPMVAALELLRSQSNVGLEEFAHVCFGITRFDSTVHMPRVYNILARLKALKDTGLSFRVKDGSVIAEGDWKNISFRRDAALSKQLSRQSDWTSFLVSQSCPQIKEVSRKETSRKALSWEGFLKRNEIETLIGRPRSTTNRILNKLIESGAIVRKGSRRGAIYRMKNVAEIRLEDLI